MHANVDVIYDAVETIKLAASVRFLRIANNAMDTLHTIANIKAIIPANK
jgi:hypothetical protein